MRSPGVRLGEPRVDVESTESTQALLEPSMPEGAIAVADHQDAEGGRLGQSWDAPPGTALLVSVLLKPPADRKVRELTLVAAVAVADMLELATDLSAQVKWPNEVMLRRAKVAGCLAEMRESALVLDIGVNVSQSREQLPERAGSLRTLTGHEYDREELLSQLLSDLGVRYAHWLEGGLDAVYDGLAPRDFLRGRRVSVNGKTGTAVKIARDGGLEIETDDHTVEKVESGEVSYER